MKSTTIEVKVSEIPQVRDAMTKLLKALPGDPWAWRDEWGYARCYSCEAEMVTVHDRVVKAEHEPDCAWVAATGIAGAALA